jgi:hypothetical protein
MKSDDERERSASIPAGRSVDKVRSLYIVRGELALVVTQFVDGVQ